MERKTLKIIGMHCKGCAMGVEAALEGLSFISEASVNHETGEAKITVDEKKYDLAKVVAAVEKSGFGVE